MRTLLEEIVDETELDSSRHEPVSGELEGELPNPDPKIIFSVWAPLVTLRLNTKSPSSPTTKTVTCFVNKLLKNWSGTDSRYVNRDRAQRIFYNNWSDFDSIGQVDSVKSGLLWAAKWSKDPDQFYKRVIDLDNAVRNGLARIRDLYNVHGDSNAAAKRMNSWGMALQTRSNTILSCYR